MSHNPVVCVRDVALVAVKGEFQPVGNHRPAGTDRQSGTNYQDRAVDLGRGLRLGRLPGTQTDAVKKGSRPQGLNFPLIDAIQIRYAFWCDTEVVDLPDADGALWQWDPSERIHEAVCLSRWIRDNDADLRYASRIITREGGEEEVVPVASGWLAHRIPADEPDWLDDSEARELGQLLDAYWTHKADLPARVQIAIGRAETACRSAFLGDYIAFSTIALEALFKTTYHRHMTERSKSRLVNLASEVGVLGVDADEAERLYACRSDVLHGQEIEDGKQADSLLGSARLARDVLRGTLKKSVIEPEFASIFADNEATDQQFGG